MVVLLIFNKQILQIGKKKNGYCYTRARNASYQNRTDYLIITSDALCHVS